MKMLIGALFSSAVIAASSIAPFSVWPAGANASLTWSSGKAHAVTSYSLAIGSNVTVTAGGYYGLLETNASSGITSCQTSVYAPSGTGFTYADSSHTVVWYQDGRSVSATTTR